MQKLELEPSTARLNNDETSTVVKNKFHVDTARFDGWPEPGDLFKGSERIEIGSFFHEKAKMTLKRFGPDRLFHVQ